MLTQTYPYPALRPAENPLDAILARARALAVFDVRFNLAARASGVAVEYDFCNGQMAPASVLAGADVPSVREDLIARTGIRFNDGIPLGPAMFGVTFEHRQYDVRLQMFAGSTRYLGEEFVGLSICPQTGAEDCLEGLGMNEHDAKTLRAALAAAPASRANGRKSLVIVGGCPGSGRTTTLWSLAAAAKKQGVVATIGRVVERPLEGAWQCEHPVEDHFNDVLRSATLAQPEHIFLDDLLDQDTLEAVADAARDGQRFVVTSSGCRFDLFSVLLGLVADSQELPEFKAKRLLESVAVVCFQRVFPLLCHECKLPVESNPAVPLSMIASFRRRPEGCAHCRGIGYAGRRVLFETLPVTPAVFDAVNDPRAYHRRLDALLIASGSVSIADQATDLLGQGMIDAEACDDLFQF